MKGAHHMGYRLLSGIKNGFILKFSLPTTQDLSSLSIKTKSDTSNILGKKLRSFVVSQQLLNPSVQYKVNEWLKQSTITQNSVMRLRSLARPLLKNKRKRISSCVTGV